MNSRVLLIEDDRLLRDVYVEMLTYEGFAVETAADGEDGLAKILAGGWDLILLDIMLPKKDGLTILLDLKTQKPKNPNGPIILLTALADDRTIKLGLANGAAGYIIKSSMPLAEKMDEIKALMEQNKT